MRLEVLTCEEGKTPPSPALFRSWISSSLRQLYVQRSGILLSLPAIIVLALLIVYPIFLTLKLSISSVALPSFRARLVGLRNVIQLFDDPAFWLALKNTAIWAVSVTLLEFVLGFAAAIVLNRSFPGRRLFRLLIFLPWTVPKIVAANTWAWLFHGDYGVINGTLKALGLSSWTHVWLADPLTALWAVIVAEVWQGYGFVMLMLLAGLQAIPEDILAAGRVDGATPGQVFRYIIVPCLRPVIVLVVLLLTIQSVNAFIMVYTMTGGGPAGRTEILGLYIYRLSFLFLRFEVASAGGVVLLVLAFTITFFYMRALGGRKGERA